MPGMPRLDYRNVEDPESSAWAIYNDNMGSITTVKYLTKNLYLCDCSRLFFSNSHISSIFQKCDFRDATFKDCIFDNKVMFIDCVLRNAHFDNCVFESEALLVFLKMVDAEVKECRVSGS